MPAPPRLCSCGAIVAAGALCACQRDTLRARGRRHDARRPNSRRRGYTREWEALRAEFIRLHPTCAFCGVEAQVVDHIKRHRGDPALVLNWNNLQSLCKRCHDSEKQRQERDFLQKGLSPCDLHKHARVKQAQHICGKFATSSEKMAQHEER